MPPMLTTKPIDMALFGRLVEAGPETGSGLLLEDGTFFLLLEDGGFFRLEG